MGNDYFRNYKPNLLIIFIIFLSIGIGAFTDYVLPKINTFFESPYLQFPSATILIGYVFYLIDKVLWKYKLFSWLFYTPNISGRYIGHIEYLDYKNGKTNRTNCALEIEQSASKIKIETYFKNKKLKETSKSKSLVSSFVVDEFDNVSIVLTYHNSGNPVLNIPMHDGTNILEYNKKERSLNGIYYTNKEPQTKGKIKVIFQNKNLKKQY
ncbi:MAG: hypothetical protein JXK08_03330 [Flavobacteriaceae bacterium]|nr:hypothetical protein [Flavobacteriaceae bacterium]